VGEVVTVAATPDATPVAPAKLASKPYEYRGPLYCGDCGSAMLVVTRQVAKATHDAPLVWSCFQCRKSWRVWPVAVPADAVPYDDGVPPVENPRG
jgi:hypothetical protein